MLYLHQSETAVNGAYVSLETVIYPTRLPVCLDMSVVCSCSCCCAGTLSLPM